MIGHDNDVKDEVSRDHRKFLSVGTAVFAATALIGLRANTEEPPMDQCDAVPIWYSFDLVKDRVEEGGWTHKRYGARVAFSEGRYRCQSAA